MRKRRVLTVALATTLALSMAPVVAVAADGGVQDDGQAETTDDLGQEEAPTKEASSSWIKDQIAACNEALAQLGKAQDSQEKLLKEIEQHKASLAEYEGAIADAQSAADEAEGVLTEANAGVDDATESANAAHDALAENEAAVEEALARKTELEDELSKGTSAEEEALAAAHETLESAEAARVEARNALAQLQQRRDEGAFGFFQSVGATDAIDALENATYAAKTVKGDTDDATSLDSMLASLDWMAELNGIRAGLGLNELLVSDVLMAYAQSDANYSDTAMGHARQFSVGENVAWNYGSDPFDQWYDEEKAIFDEAYAAISGNDDELLGADAEAWYAEHEDEVEAYLSEKHPYDSVGHYLNDISSDYAATGFAVCARGTMNNWRTYAQVFDWRTPSEAYTVDEYRSRVSAYVDDLDAQIEEAVAAFEDAEQAVTDAEAALADAEGALAAKEEQLTADQEELDGLEASIEELQATQEELASAAEEADAALAEAKQAAEEAQAAYDEASAALKQLTDDPAYVNEQKQLASLQEAAEAAALGVEKAQATYDAALAKLNDATNLANAQAVTVTVDEDSYDKEYDGSEKKPEFAVVATLPDGSEVTLEADVDFTVAYKDNVAPASGKGTIVLTGTGEKGTGSWWGTREVAFEIGSQSGKWVREKGGSRWWYRWDDGTYPVSRFLDIDGKTYYFNASGWMVTGWKQVGEDWYWFKPSGVMVSNAWQKVGSAWYAFDESGKMRTGWFKSGSSTYYLKDSGAMATGWLKVDGSWYWFKPSGAMATGWLKDKGSWYWLDPATGAMRTGWLSVSGTYYYLKDSGAMATGWLAIGGKWYHFSGSGSMDRSKWISGTYYVGKDGVMAVSTVTEDGYTVGANGAWIKSVPRQTA